MQSTWFSSLYVRRPRLFYLSLKVTTTTTGSTTRTQTRGNRASLYLIRFALDLFRVTSFNQSLSTILMSRLVLNLRKCNRPLHSEEDHGIEVNTSRSGGPNLTSLAAIVAFFDIEEDLTGEHNEVISEDIQPQPSMYLGTDTSSASNGKTREP